MQTPDNTSRLRRLSKPTPPDKESVKKYIMSSPTNPGSSPIQVDPSVIQHSPIQAGLSSLQYQDIPEPQTQPITCTLSQTDIVNIALQLKEMLHAEIDYTIKATIDQYESEIDRLSRENQTLRDDIDALENHKNNV